MKCHVQKRFQSDVYDNCKPVHRSKCVVANNFEISKECLSKKTETHFQQYSKKCNNLMNDSCFKAKKEFDRAKQEFVKFPDNMCSQIIFMNIKKQYKITLRLSEKAFKEYQWTFTKLLTSEINKRFIRSSGQLSDPYREILLAISKATTVI